MAKLIENVYGTALLDAAKDAGRVSAVRSDSEEIIRAFDDNPDYMRILTHPEVTPDEKKAMIHEAFGDSDELILATADMLIDKKHIEKLPAVLKRFINDALEAEGIGTALVTSAAALSDSEKSRIEEKLIQTTGYRSMRTLYKVDENIIGGLIIKIGDRTVDSSISTQIKLLRSSLERNEN